MSYARNVHFTLKNGKVEEFNRLMHAEVLPLLNSENGFRQNLTLLGGNIGMSISVWDDRASAEAYNTKTYPTILKKLGAVLDGPPRVETYDTMFTVIH
jgi:quinol monooxygenase YgiN